MIIHVGVLKQAVEQGVGGGVGKGLGVGLSFGSLVKESIGGNNSNSEGGSASRATLHDCLIPLHYLYL